MNYCYPVQALSSNKYKDAVLYMSRLVSRHPMEFDKELYDECCTKLDLCSSPCESHDIYKRIKDRLHAFGNSFYFLYPPDFMSMLDDAGLLEFNPYAGKTYNDIYNTANGDCEGIDMKTKIVDNPGFAPIYNGDNGRKDVEGFAGINGFFNEDYIKLYPNYQQYWHEGVDFAGTKNTVIKSLVFGEVVDLGTHKKVHDGTGMGDYMIVRDAYDKNKYYLLLHLAYESWKKYNVGVGTKVYPGMKVAGVGKPDYPNGAYHLHVSVVVLDGDEVFENIEREPPPIIRDSNYCFPIWSHKDKMRDPFNHKTTWKGRW